MDDTKARAKRKLEEAKKKQKKSHWDQIEGDCNGCSDKDKVNKKEDETR